MAELKFLRGSYTGWTAFTKDPDSFYIVEEQDGRFSLYLGEKFLCDGVSKADLATAITNLVNGATEGYNTLGGLETKVKALEAAVGEGGSVADKITAAIGALDAEVTSTDDTHVTVKVTEVDGVINAVNVTESDIASASATTAAIEALDYRLVVIEGEGEGSIKKAVADAKAAIEGELAETDAKTLAALNDRIDTVSTDAKSYSIAKVEGDELAGLDANVREAFKLVDEDGTKAGEYIKVYKDSALQSVVLDGQELVFTYLLASGQTDVVRVDVSDFLAESEFKDGLKVVDHVVSVKVDAASESFLTVGADGVKVSGVQDAIDAAVSAEATARTAADKAITDRLVVIEGEGEGSIKKAVADEEARAKEVESDLTAAIAAEAKTREEEDGKLSAAIAAAKAAATTKVVEGTDGGNNLEVVSATSEDSSVTYTINLTDVASAQALAKEVEDRVSAVSAETSARIEAMNTESALRKAAEKANADAISAETAARTEAVSALTQTVASNKTAAEKAVADEKTRAEGKEGELAQAIADEATTARAAESALQTQIGSGFSSSSTVAQAIAKEVEDRAAADKAITDRLVALEDNTITGSNNIAVETDDSGNTVVRLEWGTF